MSLLNNVSALTKAP